jgi:hypothetical protein
LHTFCETHWVPIFLEFLHSFCWHCQKIIKEIRYSQLFSFG